MFVLEKGTLISLSFGRLRGADAVAELVQLDSGTCQFNTLQLGRPQLGLPSVAEVIALLSGERSAASVSPSQIPSGDSGTPSSNRAPSFSSGLPKIPAEYPEDAVVACISKELVNYLGPIASVLARSLAKKKGGVHSVEEAEGLIDALGAEIPDGTDRERFEKAARHCVEKFK